MNKIYKKELLCYFLIFDNIKFIFFFNELNLFLRILIFCLICYVIFVILIMFIVLL